METGGRLEFGVCAAEDVHYLSTGGARAAAVLAADAAFAHVLAERTAVLPGVPPCRPGEFYLRELPPLRAVLEDLSGLGLLVVDGYADLDPSGRPGLGARAHAEFGLPVIGVAKSRFRAATHAVPVLREGRPGEQFELNIVRVAEDEHGSARYGVRRRDRGMDHCGVRQPRRPGLEFLAVRDGEGQVIQAGARLVERVLAAVPMLREPQASLQAVMPELHLAACPAGRLELADAPEAEHFLIPGRARVNVTNGQPKVVNAPDHAPFTASMPRAASRTGLALHQAPGPHGPSYRSIITFRCRTACHRADPVRLAARK